MSGAFTINFEEALKARARAIRNTQNLVASSKFAEAYGKATEEQKLLLQGFIDAHDIDAAKRLVKIILFDGRIIEEWGIRELRQLASRLGVRGYNFLTKNQLIREIEATRRPAA